MNLKRKLFTVFALSVSCLSAIAGNITAQEAKAYAQNYKAKHLRNLNSDSLSLVPQNDEDYCIFNIGANNGYIIVSANTPSPRVIGFSDKGAILPDSMPQLIGYWLRNTPKDKQSRLRNSEIWEEVSPLIPTQWDQRAPYNDSCPVIQASAGPSVAGCASLAMAQIMNYYQYPKQGTGSYAYEYLIRLTSGEIDTIRPSANFGNTVYNWDQMIECYSGGSTSEQRAAVATLVYHTGVALNTLYKSGAASAEALNVCHAFTTYFGYDYGISNKFRVNYTDEEWENIIYNELKEGRPVYYHGNTPQGKGHGFIVDGYKNGLYHINWGWEGYCDGYFALTGDGALTPAGSGTGGGEVGAGYVEGQGIICGIQPKVSDLDRLKVVIVSDQEFSLNKDTAAVSEAIIANGRWRNLTSEPVNIQLAFLFESTTSADSFFCKTGNLAMANTNTFTNIQFDPSAIKLNGTYRVWPLYREVSTENLPWHKVKCPATQEMPLITIVGNERWVGVEAIPADYGDLNRLVDVFDFSGKLIKTAIPYSKIFFELKNGDYLIEGKKIRIAR